MTVKTSESIFEPWFVPFAASHYIDWLVFLARLIRSHKNGKVRLMFIYAGEA
jgi:hypothetical protein